MKYETVAVAGTFDLLHKGHKELLSKAFEIGRTVVIGLTSKEFARKLRKPHKVEGYVTRENKLKEFLKRQNLLHRSHIVPLNDPYGPAITSQDIEALVISERTMPRALEINKIRQERGLKPLQIVVVNMILAEDSKPISTTRVRRGIIDRQGRLLSRSHF